MNRHLTLLLSGNDRTEVNRHSLGFFRKTLCFYSVFLPEVTVLLQESVIPARYHEWGPDSDSSIIQSEKRDLRGNFCRDLLVF